MIKKAVIPAAGLGTRFLPATKAIPKEMLPIVDKPTIQFVVEEALESGIQDILIIIGPTKRAIEEHFSRGSGLELALMARNKTDDLESLRSITPGARIHFVWQKEQRGLGDAIMCAREHTGSEPFAVLLGDTILEPAGVRPVTAQLMQIYGNYGRPVIALERVPREKVSSYGVISGSPLSGGVHRIDELVEKPSPAEAPSDLAIASRYILTAEIYDHLDRTGPGKNNEIQLTDALKSMAHREPLYGLEFEGRRHDIGNKLDYLKTCVHFALKRSDMKDDLSGWIREMISPGKNQPV